MHYHLVAGPDVSAITHEATYTDLDESLEDFVGLIDNLFQNQVAGKVEVAKERMRKIAEQGKERVVYIGVESPIKLFWFTCADCTAEEMIPIRN